MALIFCSPTLTYTPLLWNLRGKVRKLTLLTRLVAAVQEIPVEPKLYLLVNLSGSSSRAWWKSRLTSASMPRPK